MRVHPSAVLAAVVAAILMACGDGPTAPPQISDGPIAPPPLGKLSVSVSTSGADLDNDGYRLVLGPERSVVVGPNATVYLDSISPGLHVLSLEGVADNCTVAGVMPLSITVESGVTSSVALSVECDATGVNVAIHTTGSDQPFGFGVQIGESAQFVLANDHLLVTRLPPGSRTVALTSIAGNCSVAGDNPLTVNVVNRQVIPVDFNVTCARTEKRIAFTVDSVSAGAFTTWIYVADSNGAGARPLTQGLDPAWSPDGTKLVFSKIDCRPIDWDGGYECTGGLIAMDPETRSTTVLSNDSLGVEPSWSPDGNFMAFTRSDGTYNRLYVSRLDGSPAIRLDPPAHEVRNPSWSPDSKSIAFQCRMEYGDLEICVINRDGTGFKRLTTTRDPDYSPAWSPDGSKIAFVTVAQDPWDGGGPATIVLMTPNGTDAKPLTTGFDPAWSPDGSNLVFARSEGLFTIDSNGSNLRQITTGHHRAPTWRR
jgi:Tol biopolymer transport system component